MKAPSLQTPLVRFSLILAILAGLSIVALDLIGLRKKIAALQLNAATQAATWQQAETALAATRKNWQRTATDLTQARIDLESAAIEQARSTAEAATQARRAEQLQQELTRALRERAETQTQLARFKTIGWKPEEILAAKDQLKALRDASVLAQIKITQLQERLEQLTKLVPENDEVALPADLAGKVIASDPKWHFVVVNAGQDQGVLERAELLVSRKGRLVAKVRVTSVRKDCCVANVVPGSELGEVLEGDRVVPAVPRS